MALWDAAAKIADLPLCRFLADRTGGLEVKNPTVAVYAGGGYYYPTDDVARLSDEIQRFRDLGYRRAQLKIGRAPLAQDLKGIDTPARLLDGPDPPCCRRGICLCSRSRIAVTRTDGAAAIG